MKINTQYMHTIRFNITIENQYNEHEILQLFRENPFVALTHKDLANKVFSFGRDHGYYGRIFNHTVVPIPSISTHSVKDGTRIVGFCFTPQDGNSILSSISAAEWMLYPHSYEDKIQCMSHLFFNNI